MTSPVSTPGAGNGLYKYTPTPAVPDLSYLDTEYFISLEFTLGTPPPPPPPPPPPLPPPPPPPPTGESRLYAGTVVPPVTIAIGAQYAVQTAQRIDFTCSGFVNGIWWYRTAADTGVNTVTAWRGANVVGQAAGDPGTTGWVYLAFTVPGAVTSGDQLLLGVHHPNGAYGYRTNGFTSRSVTAGCLTAPAATAAQPNGYYQYSVIPTRPALSYADTEYFISPDFTQN